MAAPMPLVPPVTRAVWPSRENMCITEENMILDSSRMETSQVLAIEIPKQHNHSRPLSKFKLPLQPLKREKSGPAKAVFVGRQHT